MNGFQSLGTPPSNPTNNTSGNVLTPIHNGYRRHTSGDQTNSPSRNGEQNRGLGVASPLSPNSENGEWSSAIGHATTGGKSGRVIEKLMSENDKLKRELNQQVIKAEELQRNMQMCRPQIDALKAENDNLSHARGVDSALISRRDRKIDELKADLVQERERREATEQRSRQLERERDDAVEDKRRDVQSLTESTKHATLHSQILETSHKQLSAEYRARMESLKNELNTLKDEREHDKQALAKLDVVSEQMRQELERAKKLQAETFAKWEALREATTHRMQSLEDETNTENERSQKLSTEMAKVVDDMRWVMGVKKNVQTEGESEAFK